VPQGPSGTRASSPAGPWSRQTQPATARPGPPPRPAAFPPGRRRSLTAAPRQQLSLQPPLSQRASLPLRAPPRRALQSETAHQPGQCASQLTAEPRPSDLLVTAAGRGVTLSHTRLAAVQPAESALKPHLAPAANAGDGSNGGSLSAAGHLASKEGPEHDTKTLHEWSNLQPCQPLRHRRRQRRGRRRGSYGHGVRQRVRAHVGRMLMTNNAPLTAPLTDLALCNRDNTCRHAGWSLRKPSYAALGCSLSASIAAWLHPGQRRTSLAAGTPAITTAS
jgi:hypothetical protein